ncbi:FAD-dependent oxidoreductase [Altererythrobacter lutimaris]|uniref:FAD-dependent oxidoreductase n=1 Tax=Altererythrobacter lutimaris TaxID=2743979 RepID=A0A850H2W4_9SPHN|nr:FAD-dependent oxidoreductase [Altererythrobacter lutimaris]NVE93474.1 FAD-dependent oxidoreductase [Altererythrobacter lutimaris]
MSDIRVIRTENVESIAEIPVVIVGGGGTGLCAALAARDAGVDVLVVERDGQPMGTTAMSTGLIPAASSAIQRAKGIEDSPDLFAKDIAAKAKGQVDAELVQHLAQESGKTIDWLVEKHGIDLSLVEGFTYPGHSALRMHGMPSRSGSELMGALASACEDAGVDILTDSLVNTIYVNEADKIIAIDATRPDGETDIIGCETLILACCGFAGNQEMVSELIPELEHATFHGHPGNKGHAIAWGRDLNAAMADLSAYQGHAGLAAGYGIPILWPLITEGGIQVNRAGQRFANEAAGYSEQAVEVLRQDGHVAWSVYDETRHQVMVQFDDYQQAMSAGCLNSADTLAELAEKIGVDAEGLEATVAETHRLIETEERDQFGRSFAGKAPLSAPFHAVKVTGALFHTQGGLEVDEHARVKRAGGGTMPNLYAGGGAARGISGPGADGYMAGNGLLTATTLGRLAGEHAATCVVPA